jgi:hypothetical protein
MLGHAGETRVDVPGGVAAPLGHASGARPEVSGGVFGPLGTLLGHTGEAGSSYLALQAPVTGQRLKAFGNGPAQFGHEFYFFLYIRDLFKFVNV